VLLRPADLHARDERRVLEVLDRLGLDLAALVDVARWREAFGLLGSDLADTLVVPTLDRVLGLLVVDRLRLPNDPLRVRRPRRVGVRIVRS
jgi:hypothetical protein